METLAGDLIPTVTFPCVWHVGTLDARNKGTDSYEGEGVSVSLHPDDWARIARLDGTKWELSKPDNSFCDYARLTDTQKSAITTWGISEGFIRSGSCYEVRWLDDELGQMMSMSLSVYDEALEEYEERLDMDPNASLEEVATISATSIFPDTCVQPGALNPMENLVSAWMRLHSNVDGMWWDDPYSPATLQAPRGVIFPSAFPRWGSTQK